MEKTYKCVPFDIELAKDITCGKVEGRIYFETTLADESKIDTWIIKSIHDLKNEDDPYYVISECDNQEYIEYMNTKGYIPQQLVYAVIELPEETPKYEFKVGDLVRRKNDKNHIRAVYEIIEIEGTVARLQNIFKATFMYTLDGLELVEEKKQHDFKPFDKVLVRENDASLWRAGFYSHELDGKHCVCGNYYPQCISYEGNQELVGTTYKPKED